MISLLSPVRPFMLGAILAASGPVPAPEAEFAAVAYAISGSATLSEGGGSPRDLPLFDWLRPGAEVQVSSGTVRLAFRDGSRYELAAGSRAAVGRSALKTRSGSVRRLPSVPALPAVAGLPPREVGSTRGAAVAIRGERIGGLYPRRGASVRADDAVLSFEAVSGASRYRVEVQGADGGAIHTVETEALSVPLPKNVLRRGERYVWTVETLDKVGSTARGSADLLTLGADTEARRDALRRSLGESRDAADALLLAALDRGLGLFREADEELHAALARFPGDAGLVRALAEARLEEAKRREAAGDAKAADEVLDDVRGFLEREAPGSLLLAAALYQRGALAVRGGDLTKARGLHECALALRLGLDPRGLDAARSFTQLGYVLHERGDVAGAEARYAEAFAILARVDPDGLDMAQTFRSLARVAQDRGDLEGAEELLNHALVRAENLEPNGRLEGSVRNALGLVAWRRGDLAGAERHYRRALAIAETQSPALVAATLTNMANVLESGGDLAGAEEMLRRALAIGGGGLQAAKTLLKLASLASRRGDRDAETDALRKAAETCERMAPGGPDHAEALRRLAVATAASDRDGADALFERAIAIRERLSPQGSRLAFALESRGDVARERKDFAEAERLYRSALDLLALPAPEGLDAAAVIERLAIVARERGDLRASEVLARRALTAFQRLAPGGDVEASGLYELAVTLRRGGQREEAETLLCRSLEILERLGRRMGALELMSHLYSSQFADVYRDRAELLVEMGRPSDAFRVVESGRARALLALLSERDRLLASEAPPDLVRRRRQIADEYDRTQASVAALEPGRDAEKVGRLVQHMGDLARERADVLERIRRAASAASGRSVEPVGPWEAREALDPGTSLLLFSTGSERTLLFVLSDSRRSGAGFDVIVLPVGEAVLRKEVAAFRNLLERGSDSVSLAEQARKLYRLLLEPAEAAFRGSDRLLVSPSGPLLTLPFAALRDGARYLVETHAIYTVPSVTLWASAKSRRSATPRPVNLVAFGDPSYLSPRGPTATDGGDRRRTVVERGLRLEPLPASRREVEAIAALYPGAATVLLGSEASERAARMLGKDVTHVHFACHALLDERSPLDSALALSVRPAGGDGDENGLLQAWEVFEAVRLDADLVTLSACDTGLGAERGGEGLIGLSRAFLYAGARSVLASLWRVGDDSTAELMRLFYGHLKEGAAKADALRAAQVEMLALEGSHPYQWAGFELIGDWK